MKYVLITVFWAFGLTSFAQFLSVDSASADIFDGETTAKLLNVRTGPSTKHHVVTAVPHGTQVSILEVDDGWARISTPSRDGLVDGWVSGKYLELYEIALPQVASSGIGEDVEDELPVFAQPNAEFDQVAEPDTQRGPVAIATVDEGLAEKSADNGTNAEVTDAVNAVPVIKSEQSIVAEQVMAPKVETAEPTDIQTSSVSDTIPMQPALTDMVEEEKALDPISFEALGISCRRNYFSDSLEACIADVKVDVAVPDQIAEFITGKVSIRCDIGYRLEAGGQALTETASDVVEIDLEDGKGSAVLESHIDFLFRLDNVTRVEVGDINCGGVN